MWVLWGLFIIPYAKSRFILNDNVSMQTKLQSANGKLFPLQTKNPFDLYFIHVVEFSGGER